MEPLTIEIEIQFPETVNADTVEKRKWVLLDQIRAEAQRLVDLAFNDETDEVIDTFAMIIGAD